MTSLDTIFELYPSKKMKVKILKLTAYLLNQNLNEMQLINGQHCIALQGDNPPQRILLLPKTRIFLNNVS